MNVSIDAEVSLHPTRPLCRGQFYQLQRDSVALILWMMVQSIEEQPRPHMIHHRPKHKTAAEDQLSPPSVLAYLELSPRCVSNITDQGQPATKAFVSRSLFHRAK